MLGIELTTGQKVQVGFIFMILAIAGYFVFKSTRPVFDTAVNSWTLQRPHGKDPAKQISLANVADPKALEVVSGFGCADGRLEISQFPNADPAKPAKFLWKEETRRPGMVYQYYQDPMAGMEKVSGAFRHALAYATYNTIYKRSLSLLSSTAMTPEQLTKESDTRKLMNDTITNIQSSADGGTRYQQQMAAVMSALDQYKNIKGDPRTDNPKAEGARKVLQATAEYFIAIYKDKDAAIDKYLDVMEKLLTPEQQQKLVDAVNVKMNPPARAGRGQNRPPAPAAG
ncbi:MAG TPA: hypothetical protein VGN88_01750, partial [Phycisphaerae bacterium]